MTKRLTPLFALLILVPAPVSAQRAMSIVDLISVPVVSAPQVSPDGTQMVYAQADADWAANKRVSHLWKVRIDGSETVQLTTGKENDTNPRWSPDGKWLALRRDPRLFRPCTDPAATYRRRRGTGAHRARDRGRQSDLVARRPLRLLHR